jgi:hypothetical protein
MANLPQIAADLLHRASRQSRATAVRSSVSFRLTDEGSLARTTRQNLCAEILDMDGMFNHFVGLEPGCHDFQSIVRK